MRKFAIIIQSKATIFFSFIQQILIWSLSYMLGIVPYLLQSQLHTQVQSPSSSGLYKNECYCCWVASVVSDSVRSHRGSPPGLAIPGILQDKTLEWVAISFSNAWKWKVKVKSLSRVWPFETPMDWSLPGSSVHGILQARVLDWGAIAFSVHDTNRI